MTFGNFGQNLQDFKLGCLHFGTSQTTKETLVIATHGFIKKVDKVPANEIDRAVRLKDKYFNNKPKK
jgi:hypothetical protein